jgi:hypothetical protein
MEAIRGNRIFVLYWRCPLIRVSVIRGSTVFYSDKFESYSFFRELDVTYIITMRRKVKTALEKEAYFYL